MCENFLYVFEWWLDEVRPQFDDDSNDPGAPLLPSERRDPFFPHCGRIGAESLRAGLGREVARWLPEWSERLTPHGLRHYCASSLYERGMDLKAIQLSFRTLVDQYLANYEDADFVAA